MKLNQEIDGTAQASYAIANRDLIEVLIVNDGDADMNFFCFRPAHNAWSRSFLGARRIGRWQRSCLCIHDELDMWRAAPELTTQRAGGSAPPGEEAQWLFALFQRFPERPEVTRLRMRVGLLRT